MLVHAFRADSNDHRLCLAWLKRVLAGESRYAVSPQVLGSLIRVTTHPRIFASPSALAETLQFCQAVMAPSHCVLVHPGLRHWGIFERLCEAADARGNLVADAWFAALAIESGCEWITLDRDYARFPGLRWRAPE